MRENDSKTRRSIERINKKSKSAIDLKKRRDKSMSYMAELGSRGYVSSEWSSISNSSPNAAIRGYSNANSGYEYKTTEVEDVYNYMNKNKAVKRNRNHNIAMSSVTSTRYGVEAQHVSETINRIDKLKGPFKGFSVDTEWLGNAPNKFTGKGGNVNFAVTEIGFSFIQGERSKKGKLKMSSINEQGLSFAMQINDKTEQDLRELVDKIRTTNNETPGTNPLINKYKLTEEEFRSLKDIATYGDDNVWLTDIGQGVINRNNVVGPNITQNNIHQYLDVIENGINNLSPSSTKAMPVNDKTYHRMNTILQKQFGTSLEDTSMTVMQNKHADLPAIKETFKNLEKDQLSDKIASNILYDTLEMEKAANPSLLSANMERMGKNYQKYAFGGDGTLETLTKTYFNDVLTAWHHAGADAKATNDIAIEQLTGKHQIFDKIKKATQTSQDVVKGNSETILTAIGAVKKQHAGDMSFDIVEKQKDGVVGVSHKSRDTVDYVTTKFRSYYVEDMFEELAEDGTKYYGVMLKDTEGATMNRVTAKSKEELRSRIHNNFVAMNTGDERTQKYLNEVRSYRRQQNASRTYSSMYANDSTTLFEKNLRMINDIVSNDMDFVKGGKYYEHLASGKPLTSEMEKNLIRKVQEFNENNPGYKRLSNSQRDSFIELFPRLLSERDEMNKFNSKVLSPITKGSNVQNKHGKIRRALFEFKEQMDNSYGAHTTNLKQPNSIKSAKIINPLGSTGRREMWANVADVETLGVNIQGILKTGLSSDMKLVDAQSNAIKFLDYLRSEDAVKDIFRDETGKLDTAAYKRAIKMKGSKIKSEAGLISNNKYTEILTMIENSLSGDSTRGIQGLSNVISDAIIGNVKSFNEKNATYGKAMEIESTMFRNKVSNKVNINTIKSNIETYAGSNYFIEEKLKKHFESLDNYVENNVYRNIEKSSKSTKMRISTKKDIEHTHRGTSVFESFEEMTKAWKRNGLNAEFRLSEDGRNIITTMASSSNKAQELYGSKGSFTFNIPLLDKKNGLLDISGTKKVNVLNPKFKNGKLTYETYQNKIMNTLGYKHTLEKVRSNLELGNIDEARKLMEGQIRYTTSGIASGSSHGWKKVDEAITNSSAALNRSRSFQVDLNDLLYSMTANPEDAGLNQATINKIKKINKGNGSKTTGINLSKIHLYDKKYKDSSSFLRAVFEDQVHGAGKDQDGLVTEFRKVISELNGGVLPSMTALKGEKASQGYVELTPGNSRFFGVGGHLASMDAENSRSVLNHRTLNIDDYIYNKGQRVTREAYLKKNGYDKKGIDRLFSRYYQSEQMAAANEFDNVTLTLKTAFMNTNQINQVMGDKNIYTIAGGNEELGKGLAQVFGKAHTHEDTMYVTSKVAPLLGSWQEYVKEFTPEEMVDKDILVAAEKIRKGKLREHVIKPGDKIGSKISAYGRTKDSGEVIYDRMSDALLEGVEMTDEGNMLVKMKQFIPGNREGTKVQGANAGSKTTIRIMSEESMRAMTGIDDIEAIMNIKEGKLANLPGDYISSQVGLIMEAANEAIDKSNNMDTVGKAVKEEVFDYLTNVIHGSNENMTKKEAREIVERHHKINEVLTTSNRKGLELVGVDEVNAKYGINFDVMKNETTKALSSGKLGESGIRNVAEIVKDAEGNSIETMIGNMPFVKTNNALEHKVAGVTGDGVTKVTSRELKYLHSKRGSVGFVDGKSAVDIVLNHLEKNIYETAVDSGAMDANRRAYASIATTLFDEGGTGEYFEKLGLNSSKVGDRMLTIGIGETARDGSFVSVNEMRSLGRNINSRSMPNQLASYSILDPKGIRIGEGKNGTIRHKGPVMLQLPETFVDGDISIDKIALDIGKVSHNGVNVMPNNQQKLAAQLVEAVKDYNTYSLLPDDEAKEGARKILFDDAKTRLYGNENKQGLIDRYLQETTTALTYSKGELYDSVTSKKMNSSARLQLQGLNPNVTNDADMIKQLKEAGVEIKENTGIMSRKDFGKMIDGLDDDMKEVAWKNAMEQGENGFAIRYPTHHESSMQAIKFRVMEEGQEEALRKMGIQIEGNMYMTVGTQIRAKADYDGDHTSVFMPQYQSIDGKVDKAEANLVNSAMDKLWERESSISALVAGKAETEVKQLWDLGKINLETKDGENVFKYLTGMSGEEYLGNKGYEVFDDKTMTPDLKQDLIARAEDNQRVAIKREDGTFYNPQSGKSLIEANDDIILMTEARLGKNVGEFSNTHTKVYRKASVALDYISQTAPEKAERLGVVLEALGSNIEQIPISSKNVSKMGDIDLILGMNQNMEDLKVNLGNLTTSRATVGDMMKNFDDLGWFDVGKDGTKYFKGLKDEHLVAAAKSEYGGGILKSGKITATEVEELLHTINTVAPNADNYYDIGLGRTQSNEKAVQKIAAYAKPETQQQVATTFHEAETFFKNLGYDDDYVKELHNKTRESIDARLAQSSLNVERVGINSSEEITKGAMLASDRLKPALEGLQEIKAPMLKGAGIAAGALFLAGSIIDGPKITNNVQTGKHNQAPATDGTYIQGYDPSIFAGAPPGAEPPQARLMENNKGMYSRVNLNISGKGKDAMAQQELAQTIANQVGQQLGMQINLNINSTDSREHLDKRWLEDQFATALTNGRV